MEKLYQTLNEKFYNQQKVRKKLLNICDSLISLFIISPLVVAFWKAVWTQIDHYHDMLGIFPLGEWLLIGYAICVAVYYYRDSLHEFIIDGSDNDKSLLSATRCFVLYRVYIWIFGCGNIMMWRCLWNLPDVLFKGEFGISEKGGFK